MGFSERLAGLLFDLSRFVFATVIVGRLFVSAGNAQITDGDFIVAIIVASVSLISGFVFDKLSSKGGKK
ncbi:MAG: hypothetical protein FWE23_04265 [Chitinivibrionia bacterium]|nr:hypothetical protein [Chitinivibrionia bacterium]